MFTNKKIMIKIKFVLKKCIYLGILTLLLFSCNENSKLDLAMNLAGENKNELQNVLNFYRTNPSDSLKYQAAVFLIENMPYRFFKKSTDKYEEVFNKLENLPRNKRRRVLTELTESISKQRNQNSSKTIFDIQYLKSGFIINNIELAFKSWYKIPESKRANFNDFCNYILPYRSTNEPVEAKSREKLFNNYSWVYNCLEKNIDMGVVVDSVIKKCDFVDMGNLGKYYPYSLSVSQIEKGRIGRCDDAVNYFVNVFRSIGIVCAKDKITHWGNHHASGHSWLYLKYGDKKYSIDISVNREGNNFSVIKEESTPKVYRARYDFQGKNSFSPLDKDVTNEYTNTTHFSIKNILNNYKTERSVLCVFDVNNEWEAVCYGTYNGEKADYVDIGTNVLYVAAIEADDKLNPINYPFFVDKEKKVHFFKPSDSIINSAVITRKYGLSSPRFREKFDRIKNLNGCVFEVSNNQYFNNASIIHKISSFNTTQKMKVNIDVKEKYRFIRFRGFEKKVYLSFLSFYNENEEKLSGEIIHNTGKQADSKSLMGVFDEDPLTFYGKKNFKIGLKFDKPKQIEFLEFQARNDDNHINIGEEYELFYWDKLWKSLGKKTAKDTVLEYDTPKNSLLWLRNLTNGTEEHVFVIDENKKQKWLGFDNY